MKKGSATSVVPQAVAVALISDFPDSRRPLNPEAVKRLMKSIKRDGLKMAIDILPITKGMLKGRFKLIAGAHRLAACKALGMSTIPARILNLDQALGLQEIENIFRSALTVLQESLALVRYAKKNNLIAPASKPKGGRQPHDRGYSRIAAATGLSHKRISDAFLHRSLSLKIRSKLELLGLDNNSDFLTKLARMEDAEQQAEHLEGLKKGSSAIRGQKNQPRKAISAADRIEELKQTWARSRFGRALKQEMPDVRKGFLDFLLSLLPEPASTEAAPPKTMNSKARRSDDWDD